MRDEVLGTFNGVVATRFWLISEEGGQMTPPNTPMLAEAFPPLTAGGVCFLDACAGVVHPSLIASQERHYHHELADVAVVLYRLVQQWRDEFPFLALTLLDEAELTRAACVLWELDLLDAEPSDGVDGSPRNQEEWI